MNCSEINRLIDADVDGELDLVRHLEIAAHLETCAACAHAADASRARRAALRVNLTRFAAPPHLAATIRQFLPPPAAARRGTLENAWRLAGFAAALAACLVIGFSWGTRRARALNLTDEAVTDHIRSLMASHLTDIASTDQHTVKPWFAGKLAFSPPVVDLAEAGFPLIGGRLETIAGEPAAALVYRRRAHTINLFVWPLGTAAVGARQSRRDGYLTVSWTREGLNFVAVSEIPADELAEFVRGIQTHAP